MIESPSNYLGVWAAIPSHVEYARAEYARGAMRTYTARELIEARADRQHVVSGLIPGGGQPQRDRVSIVTPDGIAVMMVEGSLMNGDSKFGGSSYARIRESLAGHMDNKATRGIMLMIDSPGGNVAGCFDLCDELSAARRDKPIHARIENIGASAAYMIAASTSRISINETGEAGSIGAFAVVDDHSKRYEAAGITTHVVSSGARKGLGVEGTPIGEDVLADVRERVTDIHNHMVARLKRDRGMKDTGMFDGRVLSASAARAAGWVDAIEPVAKSFDRLRTAMKARRV